MSELTGVQAALERLDKIALAGDDYSGSELQPMEALLIQKTYRNRGMAVVMCKERIGELEARIDELKRTVADATATLAAVYVWLDDHSPGSDDTITWMWKEDWQLAWQQIEARLTIIDPDDEVEAEKWEA